MFNAKKLTGLALATAAAGMFATVGISTATAAKHAMDEKVKCEGVNACKGQGACQTAKNQCSGKNACKGQGWSEVSAKECKDKGGKVKG
jgi:hypothetical protein